MSPSATRPPPEAGLPAASRRTATLAALMACVFLVGTSEWVVVGLLPDLSADLHRSLPVTGTLVTWYAFVVTGTGPLVTVAMLRVARRHALLALMGVFVTGNALTAAAGSFGVLVAARTLTALTHSTAFAVAVVIAVSAAPPEHRGRVIAVVSAGWNLATVLGAPLGTWVGDHYGWRTAFAGIAALGVVVTGVVAALVFPPAPPTAPGIRAELRSVFRAQVVVVLAVIVLAQAGLFTVYTYIVPLLHQVSGLGASAVTMALTLFGLGALGGNVLGGRLADRDPWGALRLVLAGFAAILATLTLTSRTDWSACVTVLILGVAAAAFIPLLQDRALAAGPAAPTLVTAVSASAFNLGVVGGSGLGGVALAVGGSLTDLAWTGALLACAATVLAVVGRCRHSVECPNPTNENEGDTPMSMPIPTSSLGRLVRGTGPGLLLAHGAGGGIDANYGPILDTLARRHTVVGPDYPGTGRTARSTTPLRLDGLADELVAAALEEGLQDFAVLGYSLGSPVAVRAATRHPERVTALVLTAGFAHPNPRFLLAARLWRDLLRSGDMERVAGFLTLVGLGAPALDALSQDDIDTTVESAADTVPAGTVEHLDLLIDDVDVRADLPDIAAPTLVISTTQDQLVTPYHHRQLADGIPGARYAEIDSGHLPFAEQPEKWSALIREFLDDAGR